MANFPAGKAAASSFELYGGELLLGFFTYFRRVIMEISDIITVAVFCFSMVFALLGCLYVLVKLSTNAIRFIESKVKKGDQ